jgi:hypothetical protein
VYKKPTIIHTLIHYFQYKIISYNRKVINTTKARMKDGSGNPFMQHSEIKDCSEQPDAAVT